MPDADAEFKKFEGRYFSTPKKMGAQTAEANNNAGIAAESRLMLSLLQVILNSK